ncbi:protein P200-like isoform X2 [Macrobrachium rosenbergii]
MGFRLLDDIELKPPTEPFRQAESTAQANTKYTSSFYNSEQEEEEEEEEEEENETGEGETEEEEHEEEGGEEASEAQEVERTAEQEAEQEETEAQTSEAENAESPKANKEEADATEKENENQDSENKGRNLKQSDATKKELTDDTVTKEQAFPEPSVGSELVAEERVGEAEAPTSSVTVLAPSEVESTSPEETSAVLEPAFIDKTPSTVVSEPVFPAEGPIIVTGELITAEPQVGPIAAELSAFDSGAQGPAENSPIVAEILPEAVAFSDTPLLAVDEIQSATSANSQPLIMSRDNNNSPSAFSEPAVIIIGSFTDESEDTTLSSNIQDAFEREERTIANNMQVQEQVSEPFVHPVLELNSFNTEVFPVAEPLQQPAVELEPVPTDVVLSPVSEPLQQPVIEVEAVSTDDFIPVISAFEVPEVSGAKFLDVQPQETQSVPVIELEVPQQTGEAIQAIPFEELPLALPLQQVQILETADLPTPNVRPVESSPSADPNSAVFVREIELSETDNKPTVEIEFIKHRFDVTESGRSVDSTSVFVDTPEHDSPKVPDAKPIQSSLQVIEIPAQEDMVFKAKMFSKLGEPQNSEFIRVTANELEKPTAILSGQTFDSFNLIPVQSPSVTDVNSEPFRSDFVFAPEQTLVKEPEITDSFILPLETPVSAPQVQEPLANQATQQLTLTPAGESNTASLQLDNISVPFIEIPVDVETADPGDVLLIRASEPLITENAQPERSPFQGPPLLPPMMKVPRLLL